jgi:hypothetical protein
MKDAVRKTALARVRREHPDARLDRAAFSPEAWHFWCLSFPDTKDRPAILIGFSDEAELQESVVRDAARWAETTCCSTFRIYIAPHTVVPEHIQRLLGEEGGEVVQLDALAQDG